MRKLHIPPFVTILIIPFILIIFFLVKLIPTETTYKTVKIGNATIKAEVADSVQKQVQGLMFRESLPSNNGMLFVFQNEGYPGIWMINTSFPIDIIWIGKDMKITEIVGDAQPCMVNCTTYFPSEKALYVLEVNTGFVAKNKIRAGSSVSIY